MAYADPFDPAVPADNDLVSQGDDVIRQLKRALIARLESIFADLDAQPLTLLEGTVVEATIANRSITRLKIAADAVGTDELAGGAVDNDALGTGAVTGAKIADATIGDSKIINLSWDKIEGVSVSTAQLEDDSVTATKIADNAVDTAQLKDNSVTAAKLATGATGTFSGFVKGKVFQFSIGTGANSDNLNNGTYDETFAVPGAVNTDFFVFNWASIDGTGANQEVFPQIIPQTDAVHIYFKDTGLGPTDIRGKTFKLLHIKVLA